MEDEDIDISEKIEKNYSLKNLDPKYEILELQLNSDFSFVNNPSFERKKSEDISEDRSNHKSDFFFEQNDQNQKISFERNLLMEKEFHNESKYHLEKEPLQVNYSTLVNNFTEKYSDFLFGKENEKFPKNTENNKNDLDKDQVKVSFNGIEDHNKISYVNKEINYLNSDVDFLLEENKVKGEIDKKNLIFKNLNDNMDDFLNDIIDDEEEDKGENIKDIIKNENSKQLDFSKTKDLELNKKNENKLDLDDKNNNGINTNIEKSFETEEKINLEIIPKYSYIDEDSKKNFTKKEDKKENNQNIFKDYKKENSEVIDIKEEKINTNQDLYNNLKQKLEKNIRDKIKENEKKNKNDIILKKVNFQIYNFKTSYETFLNESYPNFSSTNKRFIDEEFPPLLKSISKNSSDFFVSSSNIEFRRISNILRNKKIVFDLQNFNQLLSVFSNNFLKTIFNSFVRFKNQTIFLEFDFNSKEGKIIIKNYWKKEMYFLDDFFPIKLDKIKTGEKEIFDFIFNSFELGNEINISFMIFEKMLAKFSGSYFDLNKQLPYQILKFFTNDIIFLKKENFLVGEDNIFQFFEDKLSIIYLLIDNNCLDFFEFSKIVENEKDFFFVFQNEIMMKKIKLENIMKEKFVIFKISPKV